LGAFVALAMIGHPRVAEGFFPGYIDHHGLLTVAVLGMVLGATFMGAGWWRARGEGGLRVLPTSTDDVRQAAKFSALSGAFGLWVSAASAIVPIGIVGVAALASLFIQGRDARSRGATFDGDAWRLWGRVGALGSIFFYLLEYFPSHMGLRLESNHPFYALAWWGGGQMIAEIGERWLGGKSTWWLEPKRLALPLAAILIAPATIALGGTKVFVVMDPFLSALHNQYIQEFLPLTRSLRGLGWNTFFSVVGFENLPLLVALGTLAFTGRRAPLLLWFATIAALIFTAMAWIQSRWLLNASGSQVTLALVLIVYFTENRQLAIRWGVGLATAALVFLPSAFTRTLNSREDIKARRVTPKDAVSPLARDIAAALRASQPNGEITLLSSRLARRPIADRGRRTRAEAWRHAYRDGFGRALHRTVLPPAAPRGDRCGSEEEFRVPVAGRAFDSALAANDPVQGSRRPQFAEHHGSALQGRLRSNPRRCALQYRAGQDCPRFGRGRRTRYRYADPAIPAVVSTLDAQGGVTPGPQRVGGGGRGDVSGHHPGPGGPADEHVRGRRARIL
jgi:hypothetical protein